jgi:hypothetical protein
MPIREVVAGGVCGSEVTSGSRTDESRMQAEVEVWLMNKSVLHHMSHLLAKIRKVVE